MNGCEGEDSLQIKVIPKITADFSYEKEYDCYGPPTAIYENKSINASSFMWDFGDGNISELVNPEHKYAESDSVKTFTVTLTSGESFCSESKSMPVTTATPFVPNFISPNFDGKNDFFEITASDAVELSVYNRWGKEVFHADEYRNNWDGGDLEPSVYYYLIIFKDKNTSCKGWLQVMR